MPADSIPPFSYPWCENPAYYEWTDSLTAQPAFLEGMTTDRVCTLPLSDTPWVGALCVGMLLVLLAVVCHGKRYILYRMKDFFETGRRFSAAGNFSASISVPLLCALLAVGCASVALTMVTRFPQAGYLPRPLGVRFICWFGLVAGWIVIKCLLYTTVNWVFFDRGFSAKWLSQFIFLTACAAFPIYIMAVCYLHALLSTPYMIFCMVILLILYEILLFYRLFAHFPLKFTVCVLNFAYLCTLEFIPLLAGGRFLSFLCEA